MTRRLYTEDSVRYAIEHHQSTGVLGSVVGPKDATGRPGRWRVEVPNLVGVAPYLDLTTKEAFVLVVGLARGESHQRSGWTVGTGAVPSSATPVPVTGDLAPEVEVASEEDVAIAIESALKGAGVTLSELVEQAKNGRFVSERARLAWFVVSAFVSDLT